MLYLSFIYDLVIIRFEFILLVDLATLSIDHRYNYIFFSLFSSKNITNTLDRQFYLCHLTNILETSESVNQNRTMVQCRSLYIVKCHINNSERYNVSNNVWSLCLTKCFLSFKDIIWVCVNLGNPLIKRGVEGMVGQWTVPSVGRIIQYVQS